MFKRKTDPSAVAELRYPKCADTNEAVAAKLRAMADQVGNPTLASTWRGIANGVEAGTVHRRIRRTFANGTRWTTL